MLTFVHMFIRACHIVSQRLNASASPAGLGFGWSVPCVLVQRHQRVSNPVKKAPAALAAMVTRMAFIQRVLGVARMWVMQARRSRALTPQQGLSAKLVRQLGAERQMTEDLPRSWPLKAPGALLCDDGFLQGRSMRDLEGRGEGAFEGARKKFVVSLIDTEAPERFCWRSCKQKSTKINGSRDCRVGWGSSTRRGGWKACSLTRKFVFLWFQSPGNLGCPGILVGCPTPLGLFKTFVQKRLVSAPTKTSHQGVYVCILLCWQMLTRQGEAWELRWCRCALHLQTFLFAVAGAQSSVPCIVCAWCLAQFFAASLSIWSLTRTLTHYITQTGLWVPRPNLRERYMYVYIYICAVKLLSGPSLAFLIVIIWAN